MKTVSQKLPAHDFDENVRPGHPVMADIDVAGRTGDNPAEPRYPAAPDSRNITTAEHVGGGVAAELDICEPPIADIEQTAAYLAINVLNSGDLQYAKEAIAATLAQERRRCVRIVGVHFPQAVDGRAENAVLDIERGAIIR